MRNLKSKRKNYLPSKAQHSMKNILFAVGLPLLFSACGSAKSEAEKAVLDRLKDPDSAKFGEFTQVNERRACLTVNAKNSMGGYTGDQQAFLFKFGEEWTVVAIQETSHKTCTDLQEQTSEGSN